MGGIKVGGVQVVCASEMGSDVGVGSGRCVQVLWRETWEKEEGKERKRKEGKKSQLHGCICDGGE